MKRIVLGLAVLCLGCPEEKVGQLTPVARSEMKPLPPGPPPVKPLARPPEPAEKPVAAEPMGTGGLVRAKVGDLLEFSWSRSTETRADPIKLIADAKDPAKVLNLQDLEHGPKPKPTIKTGTLTLVRVEPQTPFTFRVEVKSGKDVEQQVFSYGPDIAIDKVFFHTDPENPKKKAKAAGTVWDCIESPGRLVDPAAASLALSGGLVTETSVETTRDGAVSVALNRVGTTKATAADARKPRLLDTFETPIAIAMHQVQKLGIIDAEAAKAAIQERVAAAATACSSSLKPATGTLAGTVAGDELELTWELKPLPKAFEKCLRAGLKKAKLPSDETFINLPLGKGT